MTAVLDRRSDIARRWAQRWAPPPEPAPLPAERRSPIAFAETCGRGQFQRFRHIEVMEQEVLRTIEEQGRLIISASVRHGKSILISKWLPAWYLGNNPDKRVILAGHEAEFAGRWGRAARDILIEYGAEIFDVEVSTASKAVSRWDVADHTGGMLTLGVGGSPIGWGADLMIIDDPIKSYEKAMSELGRRRVQEWWSGTMASRVEPGGAVILVMARWHEDDLAGWLLREDEENWREIRLPAICDDPATDLLGREKGEVLWPERWPRERLDKAKNEVSLAFGEAVWLAQYQGAPAAPGGGKFPEDKWRYILPGEVPEGLWWVRGWDLAASKDTGDWTVGAKMARLPDGRYIIDDVIRGQWEGADVRGQILRTAQGDGRRVDIELPQDPGQAGKDQAQQFVAMLAGFNVRSTPVTGDKEIRANGYASQQQHGNMVLVRGNWNSKWVSEHSSFPRGTHDDQVDAASIAFNKLVAAHRPMIRGFG